VQANQLHIKQVKPETSIHVRLSDSDTIKRFLATGNEAYFGSLYQKYAGKVYGKCLSLLKQEDVARDAMQDIFMRILLNLSTFEEKSTFSTWIYSITYNYCIDLIRRRKKDHFLHAEDIEKTQDIPDEELPDEHILEMDIKYLRLVLEKLSPDERMILLMKYQDDMSIREIGDVLNKTESAIKMKIKRAKHKAYEFYKEMTCVKY